MKWLNLAGNNLKRVPESLEDALVLEYLSLDGNPISTIDGSNGYPEMGKLRELSMRGMANLTRIGKGGLSGLTGLETLRIENSQFLTVLDESSMMKMV